LFPVRKQEIAVSLKPQDTLLVLKYWSSHRAGLEPGVRELADLVGLSASEVSKGSRRLVASQLLVERENKLWVVQGALVEWLCYGVRYAYPQERTGYGRGMPTSWNCPSLDTDMAAPEPPLVWQLVGGAIEGVLIKPIYDSVPKAAARDEWLYRAMSVVEAVRGGKPREVAIARDLISKMIKDEK
jgi:hypothetical protein